MKYPQEPYHVKKKVLVFIHGFLGSSQDWKSFAFKYFHNHSLHFYQIPGHGFKPLPTTTILEDLQQFIKPLGRVNLIGYSMGGRIAMHLYALFPHMVDKLVILSSQIGLEREEKKERLAWDEVWAKKIDELPFDVFLDLWYKQSLFNSLELTSQLLSQRSNHNKYDLVSTFKLLSPARLPNLWLKPPTFFENMLFFFGKEDVKYGQIAKKLRSIKNAKTVEIENASHSLIIEKPDECAAFMKPFLTPSNEEPLYGNNS